MLNSEKKLVVYSCAFLFVTFALMGLFMENTVAVTHYGRGVTSFSEGLPVQVKQVSESSSDPTKLKAMIKGSIYENGSNMTVFGACFDGDGYLLPGADASFTAWYPNGTLHTGPNASMFKILDDFDGTHLNGTGRWGIHVTMGSTVGTYLTEIRCAYDGETAVAFGEWQNPEWVQRIGATQDLVTNVSNGLAEFRNATSNNFSSVINAINTIDVSGDVSGQVDELKDMVQSIDMNVWTLDDDNPFYVLGSNTHTCSAVDMISQNAVAAVSTDGYFLLWDGETWVETNQSGVEYRGVSVLPANTVYAWGVGGQSGVPIYSVNGGSPQSFNMSGGGSPSVMTDIKLFLAPNDPNAQFYGYVVGDDGSVYFSSDGGMTWVYSGALVAANKGRISQVVENYGQYAQPNGFMVMVGQGNKVMLHDGVNATVFSVVGTVADVDLLYYNLGYVVTSTGSATNIYKYNGTNFTLEYTINDSTIQPTGVEANAQNDVWVTTSDPSTFYHFDGRRWEYSTVGFSEYVSVIVQFDGNGSNTSAVGVRDVSMSDSKHGYACGGDGLMLIYKQHYDDRFDQLLDNVTAQIAGIPETNLTPVEDALSELTNITLAMNQSVHVEIDTVQNFLSSMNATMEYKLDNILSNVTYTQLYLNTTMYPLLSATYQNTLDILVRLGIIEGKINQTLEVANTTLGIVNETSSDVEWLVNDANKTRVRAWIVQ